MNRAHPTAMVITVITLLTAAPMTAQQTPSSFSLDKVASSTVDRPLSNSAVDFLVKGDTLWVAGGKGIEFTADRGRNWIRYGESAPFDMEAISALVSYGPLIWAGLAGSEKTDQGTIPKGRGLAKSTDNGRSWVRIEQPREAADQSTYEIEYGINRIKALAVTTEFNNITYDMALTSNTVWTASFAGGLRRSTDGGNTFHPVVLPPDFLDRISPDDTLNFELSPVNRSDLGLRESLNHRVFSVHAMGDDTIWVGTAGGINLSLDGGMSWRKFSFNNQTEPISGNFVVSIGHNHIGGVLHVWAATINALNPVEFRAISVTTDMGESWQTSLRGEFTNNLGFKGDVVYAATNGGVFRSDDGGKSWLGFSRFVDAVNRQIASDERCYAVAAIDNVVWVANADALMYSRDDAEEFFGTSWTILRAASPAETPAIAYAYPNPFSPDGDVCRIRYRTGARGNVSMHVYDFAMLPVRTIVQNASRPPYIEQDEIWDGKNDTGARVANGVYYIQVQSDDFAPVWTKVIVLQ
jgi:photosystem II stability/assembly factor-like uncharacterized protein